jgi:hypothetical protein
MSKRSNVLASSETESRAIDLARTQECLDSGAKLEAVAPVIIE